MRTRGASLLAATALLATCLTQLGLSDASEADEADEMHDEMHEEEQPSGEYHLSAEVLKKLVGAIDGNGDGKVSHEEMQTYSKKMAKSLDVGFSQEALVAADQNGDGSVSLEEHLTDMFGQEADEQDEPWRKLEAEKFKVADANKDGELNLEELTHVLYPHHNEAVLEVMSQHEFEGMDKDGDGKLNLMEFEGGEAMEEVADEVRADFRQFDTNGDGGLDVKEMIPWQVSRFEMREDFPELFTLADKDGDGQLTYEELVQVRELLNDEAPSSHSVLTMWAEHMAEHSEL